MSRLPFLVAGAMASCLGGAVSAPAAAQALPRAEANEQLRPAGQLRGGELHVRLEAVQAEWFPRATDGPRVVTAVFREVGRVPQVPGPLIRVAAGTPVRVTVRNTLDRAIVIRGLLDREDLAEVRRPEAAAFAPLPTFAFAEPLVVPAGPTAETRFTPGAAVSSFYYARTLPPGAGAGALGATIQPGLGEGSFMGALVVDPADAPAPDERVLMITRWNSPAEGGTQKVFANGRSWPFTERLEYTVGDTVRWRVINASGLDHPMHLHGFYFNVDALGDTHADTTYAGDRRPLVVTEMMEEFSAMRITWVPERPGNWLFHCHLVRHMAAPQQFASERRRSPEADADHGGRHDMDMMAGLITGITVLPGPEGEERDEPPARRIDLWTAEKPDVHDGAPELAFVVQEGPEPPAPDATVVPGSPLVLTRGEPTEIVVHNRLAIPLSVHWHGLELRSLYDGVGGWSGVQGSVRPPIPPGDSARVLLAPPRAGTFIYHTHGEPGHELSQGLYGPFLVLERGAVWDREADRVFTLASRGATSDAAPAINGRTHPPPERFAPGRTYRLRFLHISPDEFKRVRLLRDGEPVRWRPLAKDGADLPEAVRVPGPATLGLGVGETYDVAWTPEEEGVYVLEVTTEFFPVTGGSAVQRVAFGVGDVDEDRLERAGRPDVVARDVSAADRGRYVGTYVGRPVAAPSGGPDVLPDLALSIWEERGRLWTSNIQPLASDDDDAPVQLIPVAEGVLAPGRDLDGIPHLFDMRFRFDAAGARVEAALSGQVVVTFERVAELELPAQRIRRFAGSYGAPGERSVSVRFDDGALTLARAGEEPVRLVPISTTRFAPERGAPARVEFRVENGSVVGLTLVTSAGERIELEALDGGARR